MTVGDDQSGYDVVIIGAGVSGCCIADELARAGLRCVLLEAGAHHDPATRPRNELDAHAQLYWGGGCELNADATIALGRPRAVGGGMAVGRAALDRVDAGMLDQWREASGVELLARESLDPWYDRAAERTPVRAPSPGARQGGADVFPEGCDRNGYSWTAPARTELDGAAAVLSAGLEAGLSLVPEFEVERLAVEPDEIAVTGRNAVGLRSAFRGRRVVLAAGAIGNARLLLGSPLATALPALGHGLYVHPQHLLLGAYDEPVGTPPSYRATEPAFDRAGFGLESVQPSPVMAAMLVPGCGAAHRERMRDLTHLAGIRVCVRDTSAGSIRLAKDGRLVIEKALNDEDRRRRDRGCEAARNVFAATGAQDVIASPLAFGGHPMGGCRLGTDPATSVTDPTFRLHGAPHVYVAGASVLPGAPGVDPSLTILALSLMAAEHIREDAGV